MPQCYEPKDPTACPLIWEEAVYKLVAVPDVTLRPMRLPFLSGNTLSNNLPDNSSETASESGSSSSDWAVEGSDASDNTFDLSTAKVCNACKRALLWQITIFQGTWNRAQKRLSLVRDLLVCLPISSH